MRILHVPFRQIYEGLFEVDRLLRPDPLYGRQEGEVTYDQKKEKMSYLLLRQKQHEGFTDLP